MNILLSIFFIFSFLFCGTVSAGNPPEIRVAVLPGTVGLAMVKMMEEPASAGFIARFEFCKAPDQSVAKLIAGAIDVAGLPTSTAAVMYNKGAEVQIAAVIGWGAPYLLASDATVRKWTDLKHKEIYVSNKGSVPDLLLRYLAVKNGLQPDQDLQIQYTASPVELAQLTAAGRVALAALPEPWVTEVLEKNRQIRVVLDFQQEWQRVEQQGSYPQTCLVVRRSFARSHPEALKNLLIEIERSITWVNQHPKAGGELAQKHLQISAQAVEKGLDRMNLKYRPAAAARPEIDRFLQRLFEMLPESTGGKVPLENFYYQP